MILEFPEINPVAISIFGLDIRWYALAYLAGFLLGWWYALYLVRKFLGARGGLNKTHIDDFISWAIVGVILGGRLGYTLFYQWDYYAAAPLEILKIWQGGMSFHGGVLGVIFAMVLFAWKHKISLLNLADVVACAAPIGLFFGRIANFINGELFGRVTDGSWGMVFPRGGAFPRHPSQLYEVGLEGFVTFVVLFVLVRTKFAQARSGFLAGMFLILYAVFRASVEFFREPDAHLGFIIGSLSMGQILCAPMLFLGGVLLWISLKRS